MRHALPALNVQPDSALNNDVFSAFLKSLETSVSKSYASLVFSVASVDLRDV